MLPKPATLVYRRLKELSSKAVFFAEDQPLRLLRFKTRSLRDQRMASDQTPTMERPIQPVLRLRPRAPTELVRPRQKIKQPDGPWIAHPGLINEDYQAPNPAKYQYAPDVTVNAYRDMWRDSEVEKKEELRGAKLEDLYIDSVITMAPAIDIQKMKGMTDHEIASASEKFYVNAHQ